MKILKKLAALAAAAAISLSAVPAVTFSANVAEPAAYGSSLTSDYIYFNSIDEAGAYVRSQMKARTAKIMISIPRDFNMDFQTSVNKIFAAALKETGNGSEGDYLRYSATFFNASSDYNNYIRRIVIEFTYHTDASQEEYVSKRSSEILSSLGIDQMTSYDKIRAIYKYVAEAAVYAHNVTEDQTKGSPVFSAYGVLKNGSAVCQGYAQLLYRLLTDAGISCRMIGGTSGKSDHVWNIAEVGGKYYLLDVTWDSQIFEQGGKELMFFMKGSDTFDKNADQPHVTSTGKEDNIVFRPDYTSQEFRSKYPISKTDFDPSEMYSPGDVDCDGKITAFDATLVLKAYANMSAGESSGLSKEQERSAEVSGDGKIGATDAAYILKYYAEISGNSTISFPDFIKTLK
jgi:hypothetical protein